MISTRNLNELPDCFSLQKICKAIALLDAILEPEWEYRYYSYNAFWDKGEEMASMRDGEGSFFFVLFQQTGTIIKGFDKDSVMGDYCRSKHIPWPGVLSDVPKEFNDFLNEPAFYVNEASFCIWKRSIDDKWQIGNISFPLSQDPDGSERLLEIFDGDPATFQRWANDYHEVLLPIESILSVYSHNNLTPDLLSSLKSPVSIDDIKNDIEDVGYPSGSK